jgi:hypothetical protein
MALKAACNVGNITIVNWLLEDIRIHPNSDSTNECLKLARECGKSDVFIRFLKDPRAAPTSEQMTIIVFDF